MTARGNTMSGVPSYLDAATAREASVLERLSLPRSDGLPVARRGGAVVSGSQLRAAIRGWMLALEAVTARAVAIFEPDGVEFAAAMIGAWLAGKTVYLPGDVQPATCRALTNAGIALVGHFPEEWSAITSAEPGDPELALDALDADAVQLVVYTSGSSGAPQALPKRLSQLLTEVRTLETLFGERLGEHEILATVSHQHIYGLLFKILWPLCTHRTFRAESLQYPEEIVARLRERAIVLISGPAHLKRLPPSLDWEGVRANARVVFSSGGRLTAEAARDVEVLLALTPTEIYGSSETGGVAWREQHGGIDHPWTPLPGIEVGERDGCLRIRSPFLAAQEWYDVPDRVEFVDGNRFVLAGRADRIVKIEGKRVSVTAIEDAMLATGLVAEARVTLLDGVREELAAVLIPTEAGWTLMREESAEVLRGRLEAAVTDVTESLARPRRWRWLDALPTNAVGKTTLEDLTRLFAPGALSRPAVHVMERTPERVLLELHVSRHLSCFDGHFAQIPILPGVAQLDWAIAFAGVHFPLAGSFERLEAVKFQRLYRPGPLLELELQWRADRAMLVFRFSSSDGPHSSGRVLFGR